MTDVSLGLKLPTSDDQPNHPVDKTAGEWAVFAEERGFESVWMSEGWGADALVSLTEAAVQTETIKLCTAIVNTYSRTPPVLAMAAATIQDISDGRFVLGLGASHPEIIEPLHGMAYDRPVRRMHEAIEIVKQLTSGNDSVSYDGEIFQVDDYQPFDQPVPVYNAALGEANRRATGRVADGWLPYVFPVSKLDEAFDTIARTAGEAGRDPDEIRVTPQILAAVHVDPEVAKEHVRKYVAIYLGGLPNYRHALAEWYPEESEAIGEAWDDGGLEAAMDEVSDDLLFEFGVAGTTETARDQLREICDHDLIDTPILYVPRSVPSDERDQTIEALQPSNL